MASVLVTPPAIEPVSLAEAKAHLRITHIDEDALISTLIVSARRIVEARTGLVFIEQGWTCYLDDWPEDGAIALPLSPVSVVEDLSVFGESDNAAVIDPAHYYVDAASRPPRLLLRGSRVWAKPGRIANGIAIAVKAGFGSVASAVPEALRQAILMLVAHWHEHRGNAEPPALPLTLDALIQSYREMRL